VPLSLHEASIPVFIRALENLSAQLEKGRAFADERGIPHAELLNARLFEDMAPLTAQIQRASDTAKGTAVRVGRVENVPMEDKEDSFDALQDRIARTLAFLRAVPAEAMEGREDAEVEFTARGNTILFTGRSYVLTFALPNFFFHATTAYDLLRHMGVPVGKMDFLGAIGAPARG